MNRQTRHTGSLLSVVNRFPLLVGHWQDYVAHSFDRPHARWKFHGNWQQHLPNIIITVQLLTYLLTYLITYFTYLFTYLLTYLLTYLITPCSRVLLEKLTGTQPVKKFPKFHGTRSSLPHSQAPATCNYPEPARSTPHSHNPLPEDSSKCYRPMYAWVSQVVSFPHVSPPKTLYTPLHSSIRAT